MELWQFKVDVVRVGDLSTLRFADRAGRRHFSGQPYKDIDIAGRMGKPELLVKAAAFIKELGFSFPVPLGLEAAKKIFSLQDFPTYADWVRFKGEEAYSLASFRYDGALWWRQKMICKTHAELYRWVQVAAKRIQIKSKQDQRAYAIQILRRFAAEQARLDIYYGCEEETPAVIQSLIGKLHGLISLSDKSGQLALK